MSWRVATVAGEGARAAQCSAASVGGLVVAVPDGWAVGGDRIEWALLVTLHLRS